eukprot:COSAG01_NODE_49141_length_374_cov_9.294545_1_plen_72_part_10
MHGDPRRKKKFCFCSKTMHRPSAIGHRHRSSESGPTVAPQSSMIIGHRGGRGATAQSRHMSGRQEALLLASP